MSILSASTLWPARQPAGKQTLTQQRDLRRAHYLAAHSRQRSVSRRMTGLRRCLRRPREPAAHGLPAGALVGHPRRIGRPYVVAGGECAIRAVRGILPL
jgi:hypothetical protein